MHEMGLDAYRFSISWSRLMPGNYCPCLKKEVTNVKNHVSLPSLFTLELEEFQVVYMSIADGRGAVNPKGLEYYNNLIDELLKHGTPN